MLGNVFESIGLYSEVAILLIVLLFVYRVGIVRRIYYRTSIQIMIQTLGAYWWVLVFGNMENTLVLRASQGVEFVLMRTTDTRSAHFGTTLLIMSLGFFIYLHPKPSIIRSGFFVLGVIGLHEFLWNLFYLPTCSEGICTWQIAERGLGINPFTESMLITAMFMLNLAYWYRREFKQIIKYLPYWIGFMLLWESAGFWITLDVRLPAGLPSPHFADPYVNLTEIMSWYVFLFPVLLAYLKVHPLNTNAAYLLIKRIRTKPRVMP